MEAIEKRALRISDLDGATTERLRHAVLSGVSGSAHLCEVLPGTLHRTSERSRCSDCPEPPTKKAK
jgi:hypothetical protein